MNLEKPLKIFNASAGSGKTYTLVQEYLRIIVHDKNPLKFRSILAMTFTNKAATEMKTRILEALIQLGKPLQNKTTEEVEFLAKTSANLVIGPKLLEERSAKIVNSILHNYSAFSIMTIDKFTHRIIRTFAKDLNISMDFDVELDVKTLRKNVTELLFDQIGRDDELTKLMLHYAQSNLNQDKSWNFSSHVFDFSDQLFKEDALKSIDLLKKLSSDDFLTIQSDIQKENAKIENAIIGNATEALDLVRSKGLGVEDFAGKSTSIVAFFKRIKNGDFKSASDTIHKNVAANKWGHPDSGNKAVANDIGQLLAKYFNQIEDLLAGLYKKYIINLEILKNLNNLSLMNHLLKLIEGIKEEENILLISDFYKKISEIISKEPVPFIYERMGVRFEHFLLDEFQDTSHLQWINMIPLVHNSLASARTNLIVGDGKQAIYRWRGGEVEQFTGLPTKIYNPENIASLKEAEKLFSQMGELKHLEENHRSAPEIVEFNNDLFTALSAQLPTSVQKIYNHSIQIPTKKFKGFVEARFEEKMEDDAQLNYIFSIVKESLEKGFVLKDICVLTRDNKTGAKIADFLTRSGIKVISPDSLFIGKDLSVKFVFNLMSSAAIPTDKNHKIKTLEHFSNLILKEQPGVLFEQWKECLGTFSIEKIFGEMKIELKKPTDFHNLYEYAESIVEAFDLDISNNPFLQFFLEEVHLFEKKNNSSIRDFIDWFLVKGSTRSIVSPEGANAVQVMTIFKAKGLQFPVVICPFFDWRMDLHRQISWVENSGEKLPAYFLNMKEALSETSLKPVYEEEQSKFLLDNLNLVYVAFTRPVVALFISGDSKSSPSPVSHWLLNYFVNGNKLNRDGDRFFLGEFINPNLIKAKATKNYQFQFLKQKMNKPQLSFKSAESWDVNDLDQKRLFGTKIHFILSRLNSIADLDNQLNKAKIKGLIGDDDVEPIREKITNLFNDKNFLRYFQSEKSFNEKEIITSTGQKLIPDKLVFENDKLLVVDFKTGQKTDKHIEQVLNYIQIMKEMGYSNVSGELYYTESGEIEKV